MELVGNVKGKTCIIFDDIINTANTVCEASKMLTEHGAEKVYVFASHGLFGGNALKKIENSNIEKVVVTNSIQRNNYSDKIIYISVGILIAETIRRIQNNEDLNELFNV